MYVPSVIQINLLSPVGAAGKQRRRFPNCCAQFETIWERGGAVEPGSDPGLAERRVMTEPGGRASPRAARIATGAASRGGVEGDGWDDEFQFTPRADASPRSSGKRTPPRSPRGGAPAGGSTRILFYPTSPRPRGDDAHSPASSSTSRGSPDENQIPASQIPGSSGRRACLLYTSPSPRDS